MAALSKTACTASGGRQVVTQLNVSAMALSRLLILQPKVIFGQGIHPMVPCSIQIRSGHNVCQGIVISFY